MKTIRMIISITEKDDKGRYMIWNENEIEKDFTFATVSEAKEFILYVIYNERKKACKKYGKDTETSIKVFTSKARSLKKYCMNSEISLEIQHNILYCVSFRYIK